VASAGPAEGPVPGEPPSRRRGILLALSATACWSLSGVMVRLLEATTSWQIVLWRSLGMVAAVGLLLLVEERGRPGPALAAAGRRAVVAGLLSAAASALFILAIARVTIANALFLAGIAPLLAALGARALLGEPVPARTWAAIGLALAGVAVMLGDGIEAGELAGNLLALGSAVCFAGFGVTLRAGRTADMVPAVLWAGLLGAGLGLVAVGLGLDEPPAAAWAPAARDLGLCLAMGVVQLGLGMVLYTRASRHLPAAELQLLATTEHVLAPLLVWLVVAELPRVATLAGGALVLAAVVLRAAPEPAPAARPLSPAPCPGASSPRSPRAGPGC
jgi:drug/metabolite transporter (DMT)-like permease